ncbi:protoporphyrinogen/coproporphyrinogen oxidase [Sorangium sp. So ce131]|uniref:protoporphyrinogen/coproporphyrinogen oxidase n=1 Tax=Sorangium sp. So ce131 TaxID=3133282 RepID=UPI003F62B242
MSRPTISSIPVAILGAGLTGMAAGFHLGRAGVPYRLFERLPRPGGHAITLEDDGYRFDRTGHLLHLRDPATRELALGWIGPEPLEIERRSMVWSNGTYTRYPFQANTFGLPPAVAYDCLRGFIEAHFAPNKPQPRNFEEFCLAHFGEGISRHFMIPYNSRLWGVHPSEITAAWCSRFVPLPKLEDVLAGAVGLNDRELGYNTKFLYPRLGIGQLTHGLARALAEQRPRGAGAPAIELGRAPRAIDWRARELVFDDEVVRYDVLVSSAPLPALVRLLADAPRAVSEAAARLRCTHLYYLDVALDTPCGKPLHWVYVPEAKYPFYRVGCYSNFSPAMAPPGKAGLYVELADRAEPDLAALLPRVADGLVEMGLIPAPSAVRFARLRRIDHAYVVFDHGYFEALEVVRPFLEGQRILSCGRYGGWNYSSMEDALHFGRDAALKAEELLGGAP